MAAPRPSATVVLLRNGRSGSGRRGSGGPDGVEAYLQRRSTGIGLGGLWVFPGGVVDAGDRAPALDRHWAGPSPEWWAARLGLPLEDARGAVAAACRETLEEAGVLLADRPLPAEQVTAARRALLERAPLAEVLAGLGVRLATDLLRYWAFWETPESEPRRWATRFFVAGLPAGVAVAPHGVEADQEAWLPVRAAAEAAMPMLPPTRHTLATLAGYDTVAEVLAAGQDRPVERVLPRIEGDWIVLPWQERVPVPPQLAGRKERYR